MANYTVNAYNNNGTGGSVNMRSGAGTSYSIVVQVPHGATVTGTKSGTWSYMTYGSKSGYMMSVYLDDQGSSGTGGGSGVAGKIQGTNVNVRSSPSTSASVKAVVNTGNSVTYFPSEYYSANGYVWYRCTSILWSGDGYIASNYVVAASTGGTTTGTAYYNRTNAANYALQYTSNSSGTSSYNNSGYRAVINDDGTVTKDCANFVSQCLYAGGMPMNPTWYYKTPYGTYTSRTSAWTGTVSLKNMLEARGWATRITDKYSLKKGDLAFTYESESSLPHVVVVCRDVTSDGKVYICGHTANQKDVVRSSSLSTIYYRIHDSFAMQSGDWQ